MGTLLNAYHVVDAPVSVPYKFGVFSVVTPRTVADPHWRIGVEWQTQNCGTVKATAGPCIEEDPAALDPDGLCDIVQWEPFTVYVFNDDSLPGQTLEQHRDNTISRLANGEQTAVEAELAARLAAAVPAPVNMNAFGDNPAFVLGHVEQALAAQYQSMGVIHMGRRTAMLLGDSHFRMQGQMLTTIFGTPVVLHTDFDSGNDGQVTIYGTGPLVMYRGDIDLNQWSIDRAVNKVCYVAQRDYVLGWDCTAVGASTTLPTSVLS